MYGGKRIDLLADLVSRHVGTPDQKQRALNQLADKMHLSEDARRAAKERLRRIADKRFIYPVQSAGATVKGVRESNQDGFLVLKKQRVFAVADGMGGHDGGGLASKTVLSVVDRASRRGATLGAMFDGANKKVRSNCNKARMNDCGTTLSLLTLKNNEVRIGHVGDSRIYRTAGPGLVQLTMDHRRGPFLARYVGQASMVADELVEPAVPATYLLCTDGVHEVLDPYRLRELLQAGKVRLPDVPRRICAEAIAAGSGDNCTAVVVRIG